MSKNIAILLARLDSNRLPKKHFRKIGDRSLIDHCLNRLRSGKNYSIVLATSDREVDTPLVEWAQENNVNVYRGDAFDLKKRISGCLEKFNANFFARVNADSPFIDSRLIDEAFDFLNTGDYDMVTNLYPRSYPYGYSVEVFKSSTFLEVVDQNAELENITTFFYENAANFKIKNIQLENKDYSKIRLTVDTNEDLEYIRALYQQNSNLFSVSLDEIIELVKK